MNNEFNHFDEQKFESDKNMKPWTIWGFRNSIQVNDILKPNGCCFFLFRIQLMNQFNRQPNTGSMKARREFMINENIKYLKCTEFIYSAEMLNGMQMKCDAVYSFATHSIVQLRLNFLLVVWDLGFCVSLGAVFESINLIGIKMAIFGFVTRCGQWKISRKNIVWNGSTNEMNELLNSRQIWNWIAL